jgi:mannose-6-phosphate isomerase-like protein (cupin superfamily)
MKPSHYPALFACALAGLASSLAAADAPAAAPAPKDPPTEVLQFPAARLESVFKSGVGGYLNSNKLYKVIASRRVAPGFVEIHVLDTDVFYIVDGAATFVTGGTAVDPKPAGPNEIHATSIVGGTEHHLAKGDVIVIPHGIPHQFTAIDGQFFYFVVKVTQ